MAQIQRRIDAARRSGTRICRERERGIGARAAVLSLCPAALLLVVVSCVVMWAQGAAPRRWVTSPSAAGGGGEGEERAGASALDHCDRAPAADPRGAGDECRAKREGAMRGGGAGPLSKRHAPRHACRIPAALASHELFVTRAPAQRGRLKITRRTTGSNERARGVQRREGMRGCDIGKATNNGRRGWRSAKRALGGRQEGARMEDDREWNGRRPVPQPPPLFLLFYSSSNACTVLTTCGREMVPGMRLASGRDSRVDGISKSKYASSSDKRDGPDDDDAGRSNGFLAMATGSNSSSFVESSSPPRPNRLSFELNAAVLRTVPLSKRRSASIRRITHSS